MGELCRDVHITDTAVSTAQSGQGRVRGPAYNAQGKPQWCPIGSVDPLLCALGSAAIKSVLIASLAKLMNLNQLCRDLAAHLARNLD